MNQKSIGIITEYYNSINYGGVLQAFALCEKIKNMGYECEQISFDKSIHINSSLKRMYTIFIPSILMQYIIGKINKKLMQCIYKQRIKKTKDFREKIISHSEEIYNLDNIYKCKDKYDIYITGSDQVWNPDWFNTGYLLSFVSDEKRKVSYSASIGKQALNDGQLRILGQAIQNYYLISVRENNAALIVEKAINKKAEIVLDPTLLLSRHEWEKICAKRFFEQKYIFCYFLGDNNKSRKAAQKFAKQQRLKIVFIPYMKNKITIKDTMFKGEKIYDAGPKEFISLIRYAEYVFTDSFHATIFSYIFQKDFFVFKRNKNNEMSSRIYSLLELFECKEYFCDTEEKEKYEYIINLPKHNYSKNNEILKKEKKRAESFLERSII